MSSKRLEKSVLDAYAQHWQEALALIEPVDPAIILTSGEVRQAVTAKLLPDCASALTVTGTAGPQDEWAWAMVIDAAAATAADAVAPLLAPALVEPDGSTNALLAVASYAGGMADSAIAGLSSRGDWQVVQGWQGLLESSDFGEVPEGGMAAAPGMESLLAPGAMPVLCQAVVLHNGLECLRLHFLLEPGLVAEVTSEEPVADDMTSETVAHSDGGSDNAGFSDADEVAAAGGGGVAVQHATFMDIAERSGAAAERMPAGISLLMDVPLHLTVELGRARRTIREVLAVGPGSVVELDRLAGEPVDVLVNGKLLGKGEVVVINENFGIRITDIVSPVERLQGLE